MGEPSKHGTESDYLVALDAEAQGVPVESRTAQIRRMSLVRAERRNRVLNLRRAGFTYDAISTALAKGEDGGEAFEISAQAAGQMVARYMAELAEVDAESAEELRRLDNERLETMFRRLEMDARSSEPKVRERAIRLQVGILERRAKLNGLDAAKVVEGKLDVNVHAIGHTDHVRVVDAEFARRSGRKPIALPAGPVSENGEPD